MTRKFHFIHELLEIKRLHATSINFLVLSLNSKILRIFSFFLSIFNQIAACLRAQNSMNIFPFTNLIFFSRHYCEFIVNILPEEVQKIEINIWTGLFKIHRGIYKGFKEKCLKRSDVTFPSSCDEHRSFGNQIGSEMNVSNDTLGSDLSSSETVL